MKVTPELLEAMREKLGAAALYDEIQINVDFPSDIDDTVPPPPSVTFLSRGQPVHTVKFTQLMLRRGIAGIRLKLTGDTGGAIIGGALSVDYKTIRRP